MTARMVEVAAALLLVAGGSLWMLAAFVTAASEMRSGLLAAGLILWCGAPGVAFAGIGLAGLMSLRRR